jgi:hypothetical protein
MVVILLQQGIDHCNRPFLFFIILLVFFCMCTSIILLGHYAVAESLDVIDISAILIYILFIKKIRSFKAPSYIESLNRLGR